MLFTRYHTVVVLLYVLFIFFVQYFVPEVIVHTYSATAIAYVILVTSLVLLVLYIKTVAKQQWHFDYSARNFFSLIVFISIFSIFEEIFFRGVVQGVFLSGVNPVIAVLSSSVVFGLAHLCNSARSFTLSGLNWRLATLSFAGGLPLGLLFWITGSLLLPTVLHSLFLILIKLNKTI